MITNDHLDSLIARETFAEMLAVLSPKQLAAVAFRLDGYPNKETGEILGITRNCVWERIKYARKNITTHFPHTRYREDLR